MSDSTGMGKMGTIRVIRVHIPTIRQPVLISTVHASHCMLTFPPNSRQKRKIEFCDSWGSAACSLPLSLPAWTSVYAEVANIFPDKTLK